MLLRYIVFYDVYVIDVFRGHRLRDRILFDTRMDCTSSFCLENRFVNWVKFLAIPWFICAPSGVFDQCSYSHGYTMRDNDYS